MGGFERLYKIRGLFKTLNDNDIEIFIVTNNPFCMEKKDFFLNIITTAFPRFKETNLICSNSSGQSYMEKLLKSDALLANPLY